MAFLRYARAQIIHPSVSARGWGRIRTAASQGGVAITPSANLVSRAQEILGHAFTPGRYLLTHATIVASVDVVEVPNVKLGQVKIAGRTINRKYGSYHVTPASSQFVNNNGDCWSREVLLASYRTFIGGHNFLEHVQQEDLSKGRIVDAVARDIGDSVYIDILVATDRKHTELVSDIESGKLGTMSMGCSVDETQCTKCGNVAVDETQLCDCIKYAKLNTFIDDTGTKRVIAELCGHPSLGEHAGVHFIEASWVKTPAFTGAVMRNILDIQDMSPAMARQVQAVLAQPPREWMEGNKAATQTTSSTAPNLFAFDFGDGGDGGDGEGGDAPAKTPKAPKHPLQDSEDKLHKELLERVRRRVKQDLDGDKLSPEDSSAAPNDNLNKHAATKVAFQRSVRVLIRTASSDADLINRLATLDQEFGVKIPVPIYRAALQAGPRSNYASPAEYIRTCQNHLGRVVGLNTARARAFLRLGTILSALAEVNL